MKAITPIAWFVVLLLFVATLWSSHRTRERTECYRRAQTVEDCTRPDAVERVIRWLYLPERRSVTQEKS